MKKSTNDEESKINEEASERAEGAQLLPRTVIWHCSDIEYIRDVPYMTFKALTAQMSAESDKTVFYE